MDVLPAAENPRDAFERRLASEILAAERFRATLLAVLPTVAMLAFLAVSSAYPEAVTTLLHGKFDRAPQAAEATKKIVKTVARSIDRIANSLRPDSYTS